MSGDEDDVLLEIDRILAGEDEELEAAEEEPEDDAGEEVADEASAATDASGRSVPAANTVTRHANG